MGHLDYFKNDYFLWLLFIRSQVFLVYKQMWNLNVYLVFKILYEYSQNNIMAKKSRSRFFSAINLE